GDHHEADEAREYEDGQVGDEHQLAWAAPAACLAPSCTISPSRVTQAPAMISSSKSSFSEPSSSVISSSSDWMLRAYIWEAASASSRCWAAFSASVSSRAYPPSPSAPLPASSSRTCAPSDWTCSPTAPRTS